MEEQETTLTGWHKPEILIFIQSREEMHSSLVDEYAELMTQGVEFDACEGVQAEDGSIYVWDGYHRGEAAKKAKKKLLVRVIQGTQEDAEWLAFSANIKHGLRRTHNDILRIVKAALCHPMGVDLSDREIARHCGVTHPTVAKYRRELELSGKIYQIEHKTVTRDGSTYVMRVKKTPKERNRFEGEEIPDLSAPVCAFCKQVEPDVKVHQAGHCGAGICEACAAKALMELHPGTEQLEFDFFFEDADDRKRTGWWCLKIMNKMYAPSEEGDHRGGNQDEYGNTN